MKIRGKVAISDNKFYQLIVIQTDWLHWITLLGSLVSFFFPFFFSKLVFYIWLSRCWEEGGKSVVFKVNTGFIITLCKQHLRLHSDLNFLLPEMLKNFLSHWVKWKEGLHDSSFGLYPCKSLKLLTSTCLTPPRSLCLCRSVHFSLQTILHPLTASSFPGILVVQACSFPSAPYL